MRRIGLILLAVFMLLAAYGQDMPFVHPIFSNDMVVQRGVKVPVWGWTTPGELVKVNMYGSNDLVRADATGKWMAKIGPFKAGGPYVMRIESPPVVAEMTEGAICGMDGKCEMSPVVVTGGDKKAIFFNVMVGDVWICSGQSNMEMGIGAIKAPEDVAKADNENIRFFTVPKSIQFEPQQTTNSSWQVCTPKSIASGGWGGFSAVGYLFGKNIQEDQKIPIGLIGTYWGGTVAEAWTSAEALNTMPDFAEAIKNQNIAIENMKTGMDDYNKRVDDWWIKNDPGSAARWEAVTVDKEWPIMSLPGLWESKGLPDFDGVVWFKKEINLTAKEATKDYIISLGPIDDRDVTWVNGEKVGGMDTWNLARKYKVPAKLLKEGINVITIRVLDTGGGGGIYGQPGELSFNSNDGAAKISLAGDWKYRISIDLKKTAAFPLQLSKNNPNAPTVLFNGMIAPIIPFPVKGAIWYQGESNCGRAIQYQKLLPTMIKDWRTRFGVGNFGFYIVQLANFMATKPEPTESAWAELREAQAITSQEIPKTGLALAIDIGMANDIHPINKQEVARRLALAAKAMTYGKKIEYSGPVMGHAAIGNGKIRVWFKHAVGLTSLGEPVKGFAIAGNDGKFVWADAVIERDTIVVSSPLVKYPTQVRYAWADNPICNLYNAAGLPAVPFRTGK
jgi:sialate O-acetylesterase